MSHQKEIAHAYEHTFRIHHSSSGFGGQQLSKRSGGLVEVFFEMHGNTQISHLNTIK